MGTSVPSPARVGDTQPPDAVAPCLVTGDWPWHPIQVTATSGEEWSAGGTSATAATVTGGAVSPGTSTTAEQGCELTRGSGRLCALRHAPSSCRPHGASPGGHAFREVSVPQTGLNCVVPLRG